MPDPRPAASPVLGEAAAPVGGGEPLEVLAADATVLDERFAATVAALAGRTPATVLERITGWEPQLAQRGLSRRNWAKYAPLVRAVVVTAQPSSPEVAGDLLTDALSLVAFAAGRRAPLKPEFVFRESTAGAYLATVTTSSRATVSSRVKTLVNGVTTATTEPPTPTAASADADAADPTAGASACAAGEAVEGTATESVEPLLLDRRAPRPKQLAEVGLTSPAAADALRALAAVRAQVLAVEPAALRREPRFRGRGRAVPYGDVEVVALLAAAATQRSAKRRIATAATICVGVGAGVAGEAAARLKGRDVVAEHAPLDGPALLVAGRHVPLHTAFAAPVLAAATHAGPDGWLLGGGPARRNRIGDLAAGLANTDQHLVRLSSSRLAATWLAMHATAGVPLGDLVAAAGWTSAAALDQVLAYLPRSTARGQARLAGLACDTDTAIAPATATATATAGGAR